MFAIKGSTATTKSPDFIEVPRTDNQSNVDWIRSEVERLNRDATDSVEDPTMVLLFGGRTISEFRLRVAQSHLRTDLTPSHWSHAALLWSLTDPAERSVVLESPLEPQFGFREPVATNGVQQTFLEWYADPAEVPNVALLRVPVSRAEWTGPRGEGERSILGQFVRQRVIVDMPALILRWLGFMWGVGAAGNPLLDGAGLPSAVMVESLVSAAGFDLSPGLDSHTSTPEAFWQAATWWHPYFEATGPGRLSGSWCVEDKIALRSVRRPPVAAEHRSQRSID